MPVAVVPPQGPEEHERGAPGLGGYKTTDGVLKSNDAPLAWIRQNLLIIRERYGVARIGIFGSVVRNEETPASDIDILVEFGGERRPSTPAPSGARAPALWPVAHFMDLKFYLEDLLGRKTDLVIADTLKPCIRCPARICLCLDLLLYLEDILDAVASIRSYVEDQFRSS